MLNSLTISTNCAAKSCWFPRRVEDGRMTAAAEQIAPMITEPLTWDQICERYPDQWVCVVEIVWPEPRTRVTDST